MKTKEQSEKQIDEWFGLLWQHGINSVTFGRLFSLSLTQIAEIRARLEAKEKELRGY